MPQVMSGSKVLVLQLAIYIEFGMPQSKMYCTKVGDELAGVTSSH